MPDLRRQFLDRILHALFRKKAEGFVLKGGSAMQVRFGDQRLTKDIDLDFTDPRRSADSLHNSIGSAIEAARLGLPISDVQVSEPGKAELTPRWKINFRDRDGSPYHVEIEVSRDPHRAAPGNVIPKRYQPTGSGARFWVDVYDDTTLIATKLAALLGRGAPRDVFDLDLLMEAATAPGPDLVQWAIQRSGIGERDPNEVLWAQIDGLTWPRYLAELHDALPEAIAARIDEDEWEAMKLRVAEYAERLLQHAGSEP